MRSYALGNAPLQRIWSESFLLPGEAFARHGDFLTALDPQVSDLLTSRLRRSRAVSRAMRGGDLRILGAKNAGALDPVEVARIIAGHALIARSLIVPMQDPGFWVKSKVSGAPKPVARPAFPITHLKNALRADEMPLETAISSLSSDGAIEVIRAPNGTRAVLMVDGTLDERRFRPFLKA